MAPLIFLSYAGEDVGKVAQLYERLAAEGFAPWMDKKDILPGEQWERSISDAIRRADFFLVCLSSHSVNKRGFLQREVKDALNIWEEKLESDIYLIPVRLEDCETPRALGKFHWVDLFTDDGWPLLLKAIREGWKRRHATSHGAAAQTTTTPASDATGEEKREATERRSAPPDEERAEKMAWVVLGSLMVWAVLVFAVIWPWIHRFDQFDVTLSVLAHLSAAIWWAVLLWAFHHLAFQIGALFKRGVPAHAISSERPQIALLYATCDDFVAECCQSCLDQDYKALRVLICDDSQQEDYRETVRAFHAARGGARCELVTRTDRRGFKAGNLNHAIESRVQEDWILLVDADQLLPPDYLSQLVSRLPDDNRVAFVQAAHQTTVAGEKSSHFQAVLSPEVKLYYSRDLSLREQFGFVPLLGHGAMIRRSVWAEMGGFPEVVSEDFAFALRAATNRRTGKYVQDIFSYEGIPYDFGGFVVRLKKFAKGTAELLRGEMVSFVKGPASPVEKWDFFMMLFWYVLMPFVTVNGFLGAYVCHRLWREGLPYLQPILPYMYTWMLLSIFAMNLSVTRTWRASLRFYFWATAIYTAAIPVAGLSFVRHLFAKPSFDRTPKNQEKKLGAAESVLMTIFGALAIVYSIRWLSPFTPILLGQGIAYASYPLYGKLCHKSFLGLLSRLLIYLPGLFMLLALYAMWRWGRF